MSKLSLLFISLSLLLSFGNGYALQLPAFFTSDMVLQRDAPIKFWGVGTPGERIEVKFNDQTIIAQADKKGNWKVTCAQLPAGGPYTASFSAVDTTIFLDNLMVGDVWICSGQSNMEYAFKGFSWTPKVLPEVGNPNLRIMKVERDYAVYPKSDLRSKGWSPVNPESILNFSATAYFFGQNLQETEEVPIGLILSAFSGSDIVAWMSEPSLETYPYIHQVLKERRQLYKEQRLSSPPSVQVIRKNFVEKHTAALSSFDTAAFSPSYYSNALQLPFRFSEITDLNGFIGEVYLQKTFRVPDFLAGQSVMFRLARWDDCAEIYLNGQRIETVYYNQDWVMTKVLPEYLNYGADNTLTIRLINLSGEGGSADRADFYLFHPVGNKFSRTYLSGAWKYRKGQALAKAVEPPKMSNDFKQCRATPSGAFNAMIHPLKELPVKGVIWYQGENNVDRAEEYRDLFPAMIKDWRAQLNNPGLPFLFVQLPNYKQPNDSLFDSKWAELREAQAGALSLPNTAMATTIDLGEAKDIHPSNKKDVGFRLFLAAQKTVYGQEIIHSGPTFKSMQIEGDKIMLSFENTGSGLVRKNAPFGYVKGFVVAGADQQFHHAFGVLKNDTVTLHCPLVSNPVAVRYAWADNPSGANLYNKEGLPATPFRTDNWTGLTDGVKYQTDWKDITLPKP